jgi:competence protein ComEC
MAVFGVGPMIAASCGLILMGLLRTPLRCSGALVLAVSIVWALAVRQPDILISGDGHNVAVRGKDGRVHLMRTAKDAFMVKEWLAADADAREPTDGSLADGVSCDDSGCVVVAGSRRRGRERQHDHLASIPPRARDATPSETDLQADE